MLASLSQEFPIALTTYFFFNHNVIAKKLIFLDWLLGIQITGTFENHNLWHLAYPLLSSICHGRQTIPPASATERLSKIMQQRKCYENVLTLGDHSNKYPCQPGEHFLIEQTFKGWAQGLGQLQYRNWVHGTFWVGILILNSAADLTSQKPEQFVPLN